MIPHDQRYQRTEAYVEILKGLWTSPPGTFKHSSRWYHITDGWVRLTPAGAFEPVAVPPGCRVQIAESVLERSPTLSAWMEGLELSGRLRRGNG